VHIKSFTRQGRRPTCNDIVTYHLGANERGQPRADDVAFAASRQANRTRTANSAQRGGIAWLGIGALACVLVFAVSAGRLPALVPAAYVLMSVIAYIAYVLDKRAAQNKQWRTQEKTLHVFSLICGWPGALLAQQKHRHKTSKRSFQITFWLTVFMNCGALAWLLSDSGAVVRSALNRLM